MFIIRLLRIKLVCIGILLIGSLETALAAPQEAEPLHTHPTWLKLLHAIPTERGFRADIINQDFYLTSRKPLNPQRELEATIAGFSEKTDKAVELRCRFQARFYWLNRQRPGQFEHLENVSCPKFEVWSDLQNIDSLSVLQVSGYLGNPASAFGHLLLRVNKKDSTGQRGLQDLGVNFGAKIPDGHGTLRYVAKGLFGGYQAGFTDKEFYTQDQVYASTEFRDMWAYELNLDQQQLSFLIYHLWELINARFQYFFLRKNCAYHLAELLELVLDESFNLPVQPWYLPVSLFHQLTDLDKQLDGNLVRKVTFIPSLQRDAYTEFDKLNANESAIANKIIQEQSYDSVPEINSAAVLNFLLSYIDYKKVGADEQALKKLKSLRQATLAKRFSLPGASAQDDIITPPIDAPATGPKTRKLRFSGVSQRGIDGSAEIQIAPFAYDLLNNNKASLADSQFKLGELTASLRAGEAIVQQFDFIRLEKLAPRSSSIVGEGKPAWRSGFGILGQSSTCDDCYELFGEGGIGQSKQFGQNLLTYAFLDGRLARTRSRAGASLGLYYRLTHNIRLNWESSWFAMPKGERAEQHRVEGLVNMTKNTDVHLAVRDNGIDVYSSLGFVLRW